MNQTPERKGEHYLLYKNGELFPVPVGVDYTHYLRKGYTTEVPMPVPVIDEDTVAPDRPKGKAKAK